MKSIIKKIFKSSQYKLSDLSNEDVLFFEKKERDYFLISMYEVNQLNEFFESEKTGSIINFFNNAKKREIDIEKNTSLIILLELDELKELRENEKIKNQIFKIEEDEYFFRKYIIAYTKKSIENIQAGDLSAEKLSQKLKDESKFQSFQEDNYCCDEYFLMVSLFIKLHFFKFTSDSNEFESLKILCDENNKIDKVLQKKILSEKCEFEKIKDLILSENDDEIHFLNTFNI